MKTLTLFFLLLTTSRTVNATPPTDATLRNTLAQMNKARSASEWQVVMVQCGRLSDAAPGEWLPAYWAAYAYTVASFRAADEADNLLDQADTYYSRAARLQPGSDEILVLEAYVAQARLAAKPMFRWINYGPRADKALEAARRKNPANPRIPLLEGTALYYKPAMFGGGPAAACPLLKKAVEKFAAVRLTSDIAPNWGKNELNRLLSKCQ